MSYIITIGRQFGSGGRELGKRLADELSIAYYDKEILEGIEKKTSYSLSYIKEVSENRPFILPNLSYGHSFSLYNDINLKQSIDVHSAQNDIIKEYANKSSCVIIGRGADYTIRDLNPFRIFVYADLEARIKRTKDRDDASNMNDKQLLRMIKQIDKKRKAYYEYYTGKKWGDKDSYDLMINTSNVSIKVIAHDLAVLIKSIYTN